MRFFDGHCDTVLRCYLKGEHLADSTGHWNLDKISSFTGAAQFFACFGAPEDMPGRALWNVFQEEVDLLRREIAQNRDRIVLCTTAGELETAWANGKLRRSFQRRARNCWIAASISCGSRIRWGFGLSTSPGTIPMYCPAAMLRNQTVV